MTRSQPIQGRSDTPDRIGHGWQSVLPLFGRSRDYWRGKTAIVCGASHGLGLAISEELIHQKVKHLILIARNPENLKRAAEHLRELAKTCDLETSPAESLESASTCVTCIPGDLTDLDSVQSVLLEIQSATESIDLVIQAVGTSDRGTLMELTRQRLIELIDDNLVSSLHAIQRFSTLLHPNGGVIALIGSLSSFFAPRFLGGYSIAKHGLAALAQQARLELVEKNIHIVLCCPGPIARPDAGVRYSKEVNGRDLPAQAQLPGGGAKVKGLNPKQLSREILLAASRRDLLLIRPRKAWWLRLVCQLFPKLGERILRNRTS